MKDIVSRQHEKSTFVWYASYGSNMDADRFSCYIKGGTPIGGLRHYIGCDDKRLPVASTKIELPHRLYFAGESPVWSGGIAFIGHETSIDTTKAKAYLITLEQFEQVIMQESRRLEVLPIDTNILRGLGRQTLGDGIGHYDELIYCGEYEDYPVFSFTSPVERTVYTKPSSIYLKMIAKGLTDSHSLDLEAIADYLVSKPGITENLSREEIIAVVTS